MRLRAVATCRSFDVATPTTHCAFVDFDLDELRENVAALARRGIYIGTSSWRYPGWCGQIYTTSRYLTRNKFSNARFERDCLAEYAETFSTVNIDAAYYTCPVEKQLQEMAAQVPDTFRFGLKVTDAITIRRFPSLEKFRDLAGKKNEQFLDAELFVLRFLGPLETIRPKVGPITFEFSKFHPSDYARGEDFIADLDRFFAQLPRGWLYGVELRNRAWLVPEYFACLRKHGVAHVANNWTDMPTVAEQLALPDMAAPTAAADAQVARFLLTPGRKYQEAVDAFQPYDHTQQEDPEARLAIARLISMGFEYQPGRGTFIYVNNRLEGSAPFTILAALTHVDAILKDLRTHDRSKNEPRPVSTPKGDAQLDLNLG